MGSALGALNIIIRDMLDFKTHLHSETPGRLGNIEDIAAAKISLNLDYLRVFSEELISDISSANGFINTFFSTNNPRFTLNLTEGEQISETMSITELMYSRSTNELSPFTPVLALSGGYDSRLSLRMYIEAYLQRELHLKTPKDKISCITFKSATHSDEDSQRGCTFFKEMDARFGSEVPMQHRVCDFPGITEIKALVAWVCGEDDYLHGRIQNIAQTLTNSLISVPGEETGFHISHDTANQTEFLLDEVTNGATGGTNTALFTYIPKTVVLDMCKHFGIYDLLSAENSTTWETKGASYLVGAEELDDERIFFAIDTIFFLAIIDNATPQQIADKTGFDSRFIRSTLARALNYSKRSFSLGQEYTGETPFFKARDISSLKRKYMGAREHTLRKIFGAA